MTAEPGRYVQPDVSEARVERLWSSVELRLQARAPRSLRWPWLAGAVVATAACGLLFVHFQRPEPQPRSATVTAAKLETAGEGLSVSLVDGSALQLGAHTRIALARNQASAVALRLDSGEVKCDVEHRPERPFTVVAGDVEVRVVGTQFSVKSTPEAEGPRVEVSVLRGVVEIRSGREPGSASRVAAGQSWMQLPRARRAEPAPVARALVEPQSKPEASSSAAPPAAALPAGPSARELFEKAGERRRAGDAAAAARAYEELLKLHPGDARASLSAFELGRLRMDRLGDPAGASAALERAVALNVGPSFREDALARLVSVYAAQGNFAACGRARDRYLQSYPKGVHGAAVASRCGTR